MNKDKRNQSKNKQLKSRRGFIGNLSKVAVIGASLPMTQIMAKPTIQSENGVETSADSFGFSTAPYIQNLMENSVDIVFITNSKAHSWVEYGSEDLDLKAEDNLDGFIQANNHLNTIRLEDLTPGTTYKYRVASREIVKFDPYDLVFGDTIMGDVHTFRTSKDMNSVSCLILNDIHDRPYSFADLLSLNKGFQYDFVALNGDMFDYQTDEQQLIDHLIAPCTDIFASEKPFLMVRGNHETRGKFARNIKDYFAYPDSEYYFSFKQGPVHWVVLDSGEDKTDADKEYGGIVSFDAFREKQAIWLENEFQKKDYQGCKYRVVLMHIPPFHSGDWHGTLHCRKLFHPLFERYNVDMVISGHTHRYGVHPPSDAHTYPVIIGGGPKTGNRTLIQFKADEEQLNVKMIRDDGLVVGEYSVD
ncbi:metallophosphoesterase family protein [Pricia sp. S334]|uniref:Metallophosphoesterase family protein n=1 Tax=Pricia mediterranea TaxID=3076079 RepID=A0ABU3L3F8_9FLAO|nr:metallophosphoesterase family protein [Pricia sp. S334]MDT7828269.1 metallophosphoesterase family protein [Pricia sp. S334]